MSAEQQAIKSLSTLVEKLESEIAADKAEHDAALKKFKEDYKAGSRGKVAELSRMKKALGNLQTTEGGKANDREPVKAKLLPAVKELVGDNPGISEQDLKDLASERATEKLGLAKSGLALNIEHCLKESVFRIDSERRVWLKGESLSEAG